MSKADPYNIRKEGTPDTIKEAKKEKSKITKAARDEKKNVPLLDRESRRDINKDIRGARKEKRESARDIRDSELVETALYEAGISPEELNEQRGYDPKVKVYDAIEPIAERTEGSIASTKAAMDKAVGDGVKASEQEEAGSIVKDLMSFNEATADFNSPNKTTFNAEKEKELARKQRRLKYSDVLKDVGAALQGREFDASRYGVSGKIAADREARFSDYKAGTEANKKAKAVYEDRYRDELLDFIDGKLKDAETTNAQKLQWEKLKLNLAAQKKRAKQKDRELGIKARALNKPRPRSRTGKDQLVDVFEEVVPGKEYVVRSKTPSHKMLAGILGDDVDLLFGEDAKPSSYETLSRDFVDYAFNQTEGEDGQTIYTIKEGKEDYIRDAVNTIKTNREISKLEDDIAMLVDEHDISMDPDEKYLFPAKQEARDKMIELQDEIDRLRSGGKKKVEPKRTTPKGTQSKPKATSGETSDLKKMIEGYK